MPRKGKRQLAFPGVQNIYVDGSGFFSVIVKIAGEPEEKRFPPGTPFDKLEDAVARLKGKARREEKPRAGSLAADAADYLATIADKQKLKFAKINVGHWTAIYGRESRFALTRLKIEQQLAAWERDGVAASTCNKRLSALRAIFNAVNSDEDPNPAARVKKRKEPDPEPRAIDYTLIDRILAKMPDRGKPTGAGKGTRPKVNLAKLRNAWIAYSGWPPAQTARINPDTDIKRVLIDVSVASKHRKQQRQQGDIDGNVKSEIDNSPTANRSQSLVGSHGPHRITSKNQEESWLIRARPRRKGKGTRETWLPLLPQAVTILNALIAAKALKKYSTSSARTSWLRACVKVIREQLRDGETPLPHRYEVRGDDTIIVPLVTPYDLRHSFLTAALRARGNLAGVQHLAQHADIRQTKRYIGAGIPDAASDVAGAMAAHLPANPIPRYVAAKEDGTDATTS